MLAVVSSRHFARSFSYCMMGNLDHVSIDL